MKVCVSLRDDAPPNLREGNLRSEARWERQALEACLENPEVSDVYTIGRDWSGSHPKYHGGMNGDQVSSTVLLAQDWNNDLTTRFRFKAVIVNIFSGPWDNQISEVKSAFNLLSGNLYFTMGFPIMFRNELSLNSEVVYGGITVGAQPELPSHLEKFIPRSNILLLPVPGAPYISEENNFDKTNLVWASRLVFMAQMAESHTLLWSLKKLQENPSLELDVLTGWFADEVKDYVNEQVIYRNNIVEAFWNLEVFQPFSAVRDRVKIRLNLNWGEVLSIYSNSKMFATYGRLFGGPPIEASMHGIPFVGSGKTGALGDCPDYLYIDNELEACSILEQLYADRDYYTKIGDSYRRYTASMYSYSSFNQNLNKILSDRGL